jgi:predicted ATPase
LNVFVGNNGAGKSSFFRALGFLRDIVTRDSINSALALRKVNYSDLVHLRADSKRMEFSGRIVAKKDQVSVDAFFQLYIRKKRFCFIEFEKIVPWAGRDKPLSFDEIYALGRAGRDMVARDEGSESITLTNAVLAHSFLRDVHIQAVQNPEKQPFPHLSLIAYELRNIGTYEIWGPEALRQPSLGQSTSLRSTGGNLPSVLHNLRERDRSSFDRLIQEMRSAYEWLETIEFHRIAGRDLFSKRLALVFVEKTSLSRKRAAVRYTAEQVSDGFLRMLAITALRFCPRINPILLYEEPENGLHPSAIRHAARQLRQIAENGVQVLVTTHSPLFLSSIFEDIDADTICKELKLVQRDNKGATIISSPDVKVVSDAIANQISVGDLWSMLLDESPLSAVKNDA